MLDYKMSGNIGNIKNQTGTNFHSSPLLLPEVDRRNAGTAELDVTAISPLGKNLPIEVKSSMNGEVIELIPAVAGRTLTLIVIFFLEEIETVFDSHLSCKLHVSPNSRKISDSRPVRGVPGTELPSHFHRPGSNLIQRLPTENQRQRGRGSFQKPDGFVPCRYDERERLPRDQGSWTE